MHQQADLKWWHEKILSRALIHSIIPPPIFLDLEAFPMPVLVLELALSLVRDGMPGDSSWARNPPMGKETLDEGKHSVLSYSCC